MHLLNPRVDLAFKKIFGSKENKDLLISFINSVVSEADQVVDVELLNPHNSRNSQRDKPSILDVKAKDTRGNYYNIEVQICNEGDYDKRSLYYWAKLYTDQLGISDPYKELRKAIAIHVLNFISVPNAPNYCNRFTITNEETGQRHFEDLEIYTIELCKFSDFSANEGLNSILPRIKTNLDRWATFLTKAGRLDRNNLPKELDDPCIKKAVDVLTHVSLDPKEREMYEDHLKWLRIEASTLERAAREAKEEGMAEGEAKGRAEGRAEGEAQATIKFAKQLLNKGMQEELVCEMTGLSSEDLLNLDFATF